MPDEFIDGSRFHITSWAELPGAAQVRHGSAPFGLALPFEFLVAIHQLSIPGVRQDLEILTPFYPAF